MQYEQIQESLGHPDIKLAGLAIWIHNRPYQDSECLSDFDWLGATVHCGSSGASVWVHGNILSASGIARWQQEIEAMRATLAGDATLDCYEPNIRVTLKAAHHGLIEIVVEITPDHLKQSHEFSFNIDQSYLPAVIQECGEVLKKYPANK